MVDSENSRTIPRITRRNVQSVAAAYLMTQAPMPSVPSSLQPHRGSILLRWRHWNKEHRRALGLSRQQQRLEAQLLEAVGDFPVVSLIPEGEDGLRTAYSDEEIDHEFPGPGNAAVRMRAKTELARLRGAWNAADETLGYSRVKQAEAEAYDRAKLLAGIALRTPASTITGVVAKLHITLTTGEDPHGDARANPHAGILSALVDLLRIATGKTAH